MRFKYFLKEDSIPDLNDGEYAIPYRKREKVRKLNKRTNRMRNSKIVKYFKTDIPPDKRTLENLPRYSDGSTKCTFQQWLGLRGNGSDGCKGYDGRYYGWSHRAIASFGVGDVIKGDMIGNKYQYSDDAQKEYMRIMNDRGLEEADKYIKTLENYEPYIIKTEQEAIGHAIRFGRGVS